MILLFTGNGKGKTTASLGQALRVVGYGKKVLMIQFLKGPYKSGEELAVDKFGDDFKIIKGGLGFVGILGDKIPVEEHKKSAEETWSLAKKEIISGIWDMVILDEINNAISLNLIPEKLALDFLRDIKSNGTNIDIVLTGRDASPLMIEMADLVTEMKEVKHPYNHGEPARRGVEF